MLLSSSHSPSPISFSLHPPLSPAFHPFLSPFLPPSSSSAASSSSHSSTASRRSTSPLLLASLPPSSSLSTQSTSTSVATLSSSFLTDVAINDGAVDHPSANRQPVFPRSVFASSSSSASAMSTMPSHMMLYSNPMESTNPIENSNPSFDIPSSSLDATNDGDIELQIPDDDEEDEESHNASYEETHQEEEVAHNVGYEFHVGPLDMLSNVVSAEANHEASHGKATGDSTPRTPRWTGRTGRRKGDRCGERRVSRACIHCSASKTKCDNKRPCARCVRTKRAATCQDIPRRKRVGRGKRPRELVQDFDDSDSQQNEYLPEVIVKQEDDLTNAQLTELAPASPAFPPLSAASMPGGQPDVGSHVVTYASHTTMVPHDPYAAAYSQPLQTYVPQPMPPSYDNHPMPHMPADYTTHYWHPPAHTHPHTHTHPYAYPQLLPSATQAVFTSPAQYTPALASHHVHTAPPAAMLSPVHAAVVASTAPAVEPAVAPAARLSSASPTTPATARSTSSFSSAPSVPVGTVLSRLRMRLPRALHRAHAAVIDQFHGWSDLLALRQQQGLVAPGPLLKARSYVYHMLRDGMLALEDEDRQQHRLTKQLANTSGTSPPLPIFSPPTESEQNELLRLIHQKWDDHLFPANAVSAEDDVDSTEWENKVKDGGARTLDAIFQRRVVTPTFIIPLLSFSFLTSPPWLSASFSSLLGYEAKVLSASTQTPLDLLHRRQHADIAPLIPAFLSAITARADHYLHSSGWVKQGGDTVQLMANVRVMYSESSGFPVAVMAQFTSKEEADESFAPILARMGNLGSASAVKST